MAKPRSEIQRFIHVLLCQRAEQQLLAKQPEVYYGWVPPQGDTPGYWLGAADELRATQAVCDAQTRIDHYTARLARTDDPEVAAQLAEAEHSLQCAEAHLAHVQRVNTLAIEKRRALLIEQRASRLFYAEYRRARVLSWPLFHPSVSGDLRRFLQHWHAQPTLSPSSLVFLWLVLQETIAHGESHGTEAITGYDYLAAVPLVRASLDIEACEDEPHLETRQYIQALQAQHLALRPDAHENGDRRDVLADFQYDGLPEQLGALYLDKDSDTCANCGDRLRTKTVHSPKGYALATVCPQHRERVGCTHEVHTPRFPTKIALRDYLCLAWARQEAQAA